MSMETDEPPKNDPPSNSYGEASNVVFGEIQVLLAEKRTALASLRTGIAVSPTSRLRRGREDRGQRSEVRHSLPAVVGRIRPSADQGRYFWIR